MALEICLNWSEFLACELYRVKESSRFIAVTGFGPAVILDRNNLALLCGNEDCEVEIPFTFWSQTTLNSYHCEVCGSDTCFDEAIPIGRFADLL